MQWGVRLKYLSVKNWDDFQHYKDRTPPWIKLHRTLLDDYAFSRLQDASKAHLMLIWLLASQMDNKIPYDDVWIGRKIGATDHVDIKSLIDSGFLFLASDDSDVLANCTPETEEESEKEREKKESPLPPKPDGDLQVCVDLYNDMAAQTGLPACQVLSDARKTSLAARLKECGGMDGWKVVLEIVASSDFLTGKKTDFKATFDFILQKSSFIKIMEGNYNNHKATQGKGMSYFDEILKSSRELHDKFGKENDDIDSTDFR